MQKIHQKVSITKFIEHFFIFISVCFALLISTFILCPPVIADIRPVVIRGDAAPGIDGDFKFEGITQIAINNSGQATFTALVMSGSTYYRTIWINNSGTTELIAVEGQTASGISGDDHFIYFDKPIINDAGQVMFVGTTDGNENTKGVWKGTPGSLSLIVREGDVAPGTVGDTFLSPDNYLCFNNSGLVAFNTSVAINNNTSRQEAGIWQETASGLTKVIMTGDEAPGFAAAGSSVATYSNIYRPLCNNNKLVFSSSIGVPWYDSLNWTDQDSAALIQQKTIGGSITTKYKGWTAAPGVSGGEFEAFYEIFMNASGQLIFDASTRDEESQYNRGIWSDVSGNLALVALLGSQAPGTPSGAVFSTIGAKPFISDSGQVAIYSTLLFGQGGVDTSNNIGIWIETNGVLELIVRAGDNAPGTPEGTVFGTVGGALYGFNSAGQFCFSSYLIGPSGISYDSIWVYDPTDGLSLIVSDGDQVTLTTGETVTFYRIYPHMYYESSSSDGFARAFNNNGEIAFGVDLSDGRNGFFIANTDSNQSLNTYYEDSDNDSFGNSNSSIENVAQPTGYVTDNTDCDDSDNSIYPGAAETAGDGIDQDCDGSDLAETNEPISATLLSPDNAASTPVTYTWNAVSNSTWYYLWVNDSSGTAIKTWYTSEEVGCESGAGTCSITSNETLASGSCTWWIRTWNANGFGEWSNGMSFSIDTGNTPNTVPNTATLTSPSGTDTDTTPTYTWNAVSNSTWYYLWVDDSTGNAIKKWYTASESNCSSGSGTCSITPSISLDAGNGTWWIRTWNNYGYGDWSDGKDFTVTGGNDPTAGESCGSGLVYDCAGDCVDADTANNYIGDGYCDDGTYGFVLTCSAFNNDDGDCE